MGSWRSDDDRARISKPPLLWLVPQSDHGSAACAETEAVFQHGPPQSFFQLSWLALQKARREVGATIGPTKSTCAGSWRTGRKLLRAPLLALVPQSDHGRAACAETEAFFQYGPPQSFFKLSWLALQKARAREVGATMMTGREFLCPPSYGSFRNPITGVPRARKLKAFFQHGPPQSFFELSWLALQKARREVGATIGSLRNPITGVPRARKLKLFSNMARRSPFSS